MIHKHAGLLLSGAALFVCYSTAQAQEAPTTNPRRGSSEPALQTTGTLNATAPSSAPVAQSATSDAAVADIVVTATKRAQNTTQIPASITAIGEASLEQRRIVEVRDLNALVPGVQISPNNTDVSVTIRGVGHTLFSPAAENSVAMHLDGVYLSRPAAAQSAFFDVSRIEVLRGPQGTLYGRNATGGAINIVSNDPTHDFSGSISATGANYNRTDIEAVVSGPIAGDSVLGRFGGYYHRRGDGFGTNLVDGSDVDNLNEYGFKGAVVAEATDRLKLTVRGDYYHASDAYGLYHNFGTVRQPYPGAPTFQALIGGITSPDIRDTNYNDPNHRYADIWGLSAAVDYKLADHLSVKSTTGYRRTVSSYSTDTDGTQLPVFDPFGLSARSNQFSEELQLSYDSGPVYAILGGYYFDETTNSDLSINSYLARGLPSLGVPPLLPAPFGAFNQVSRLHTDAKAIFGNVDLKLSDRLTLTGGLRYSDETKSNRGYEVAFFPDFTDYPRTGYETVDASRSSHAFTPKVSIKYDLTSQVNVYASASRGFKSGEFIAGTNQYALPETLWDYEVGLKGTFFDHALRMSIAGFYYDYTNLQVQRLQTPFTFLENVPKSRIFGVEGEAVARLPAGFSVDGNFTYLDSRLGDFFTQDPNLAGTPTVNIKGNRFAFAPKFNVNAGIEKKIDFSGGASATIRFDAQHTSDTYLDILNSNPTNYRPSYEIFNASARLDLPHSRISLLFWAKNLTDKTVILNSTTVTAPNVIIPTSAGAPPYPSASNELVNLNDPRTYGVTMRLNW